MEGGRLGSLGLQRVADALLDLPLFLGQLTELLCRVGHHTSLSGMEMAHWTSSVTGTPSAFVVFKSQSR